MRSSRLFILLTIVYAAFIFYLSSLPSHLLPGDKRLIYQIFLMVKHSGLEFIAYPLYPAVRYPDKFVHLVLYFGFGILLHASFRFSNYSYPSVYAFFVGALYGISDEIHQIFVPGRTASILDFTADVVGLVAAQIIILIFIVLRSRKCIRKREPNI